MRRPKTMAIWFDDGVHVYAVKYKTLAKIPDHIREFPCMHCPSLRAKPEMDIVQFGFMDDAHQLVCFCPDCLQLTIIEYKVSG